MSDQLDRLSAIVAVTTFVAGRIQPVAGLMPVQVSRKWGQVFDL